MDSVLAKRQCLLFQIRVGEGKVIGQVGIAYLRIFLDCCHEPNGSSASSFLAKLETGLVDDSSTPRRKARKVEFVILIDCCQQSAKCKIREILGAV